MPTTKWTDTSTGQRLSYMELERMRLRARRLYEVNSHIFEDEVDALTALGVVPWFVLHPEASDYASAPAA